MGKQKDTYEKYKHLIGTEYKNFIIQGVCIDTGKSLFECKCVCGGIFKIKPSVYHRYRNCGNCPKDWILNESHGRLTVVKFLGRGDKKGYKWQCVCVCGEECIVEGSALIHGRVSSCGCARSGVKTKNRKIFGLAVNNADSMVGGVPCRYYRKWHGMLYRALVKNNYTRPTYKDVGVCEDWLVFSNFKDWCVVQEEKWGINVEESELDKDILCYADKDKLYSPSTCLLVPSTINQFIKNHTRGNLLDGVSFHKGQQKFTSKCVDIVDGRRLWLGTFESEVGAHIAYLSAKVMIIEKYSEIADGDYIKYLCSLIKDRYQARLEGVLK